jgi:hypothetical protein
MAVGDRHHYRTLRQSMVDNASSSSSLGIYRVVRGVGRRALLPRRWWEGCQRTAMVANRTQAIRPSGNDRGASGNATMVDM